MQRVEQDRIGRAVQADRAGVGKRHGAKFLGTAAALRRAGKAATALHGVAGVDHVAAAAGQRVAAQAQGLIARHGFGADELNVAGQPRSRSVEAARVKQVTQAGRGAGCQHDRNRHHDTGLDEGQAALLAAAVQRRAGDGFCERCNG